MIGTGIEEEQHRSSLLGRRNPASKEVGVKEGTAGLVIRGTRNFMY